jgi:hypothetical protein
MQVFSFVPSEDGMCRLRWTGALTLLFTNTGSVENLYKSTSSGQFWQDQSMIVSIFLITAN